jgi:phosphatidylglycerophosphate synthase
VSEAAERRPIAARQWRSTQAAARWLARQGIGANAISIAGMVCGIAAGLLLAATAAPSRHAWLLWLLAAALVQARLLANMLDGMVAIETGTASRLGEIYNEVPDRVSDSAILIGLGYAAGGDAVLGYAAALVAALTAYIRCVGRGAGARQEFCGPMAKQQRMALVTLVALYGALVDPTQGPFTARPPLGPVTAAAWIIIVGGLATALRRLRRIAASLGHVP